MGGLRRRWQGKLTDERVASLSDAAAVAAGAPTLVELQLDLKAYTPVPDAAPGESRANGWVAGAARAVSSTSDRDLRRLHGLTPDLALGFDPLRHLDVDPGPGKMASRDLRRTGAYGYLDDHALADRWGAR